MKKIIKVQRLRDRTIVIYKDPPKVRPAAPVLMQTKPVPVTYMGQIQYWIMPDGSTRMPRKPSIFKHIIRRVTSWSVILTVPMLSVPHIYA